MADGWTLDDVNSSLPPASAPPKADSVSAPAESVTTPKQGKGGWSLDDVNSSLPPVGQSVKATAASNTLEDLKRSGKFPYNQPGTTYGDVWPLYRDATGHTGMAWPEAIRAPMRGVAEWGAALKGERPLDEAGHAAETPDMASGVTAAAMSPVSRSPAKLLDAIPRPEIVEKPPSRINNVTAPFGPQGRDQIVGDLLNKTAPNAEFEEPPLPGMKLSAGQASNDPKLLWLEKGANAQNPELATEAQAANNSAIRTAIGKVGDLEAGPEEMRAAIARSASPEEARMRVLGDLKGSLGVSDEQGFYDAKSALDTKRKTDAAPLYDEAFAPGSVAPLKDQFDRIFQQTSADSAQAARDLQQAQNGMTVAAARVSRAGDNVYAANEALSAQRQAQIALDSAQRRMADTDASHQQALGALQSAQEAEASGLRGGVWSPRVQQFLDDPLVRSSIPRGLEVQRLEALAENKPFNPTDYAVTGVDADGAPVVSKVPNMRLLDTMKRGMDAMIEDKRDPITGRIVWDERTRAIDGARRSLLTEMDRLNPVYADARKAYAGPSASLDALHAGRNFMKGDIEQQEARLDYMDPANLPYYRMGVARWTSDQLNSGADGLAAVRKVFSKPQIQARLKQIFPPDAFDAFMGRTNKEMSADPLISRVLATDAEGSYKFPASGVADQFIKKGAGGPEALQSYLKTVGDDSAGLGAARDAFAQKLLDAVQNTPKDAEGNRLVSNAKMTNFLDDYSHVVNSKLFSPEQKELIARIGKASDMAARVGQSIPGGGSDTASKMGAKLFTDKYIDAISNKLVIGGLGAVIGAGTAAATGMGPAVDMLAGYAGKGAADRIGNAIYAAPAEKIRGLLGEALHDPEVAKALMKKASPGAAATVPAKTSSKIMNILAPGIPGSRTDESPRMAEGGSVAQPNWIKTGTNSYNTELPPDQEQAFRSWVQQNKVPFDPNAKVSDYDMRGFYKGLNAGDPRATSGMNANDGQLHYSDYWKTPYHKTFSNESQWATDQAPHWEGSKLVAQDGKVISDESQPPPQSPPP